MFVAFASIRFNPTPPESPFWRPGQDQPAWRVGDYLSWNGVLHPAYIPLAFASKRDAEIAMKALEDNKLTTKEAMLAAGPDVVYRVMVENLPW